MLHLYLATELQSINENCELYFHTQWPLARNDVTQPLCLLHYCLFMPLCFAFATLTYLLCLLCWCAIYIFCRIPCLAYIFLAGKRIQYEGVLFPYIPVLNHVHKINYVHVQLEFQSENCIKSRQGVNDSRFSGCSEVYFEEINCR